MGIVIGLGAREHRKREDAIAGGEVVVRSPRGVRPAERALLHALPTGKSGSALVLNSAEAVTGLVLRALNPALDVHCHFDDAWGLEAAQRTAKEHRDLAPTLDVAPDPPPGPWDVVCLPFEHDNVRELLSERVAFAAAWLRPGGLLYASTDERKDRFVRGEIEAAFGSLTAVPGPTRTSGVAYVARRSREPTPAEVRPPRPFAVLEGERELTFASRPGVFCHGRLDPGTRALLALADFGDPKRVLDLGCGVGVIGVVAAVRCPEARITMVDSYARAVECARRNAETNDVAGRCEVVLSANALRDIPPGYGLVVTNPPYYGNYRIGEMFLDTAKRVLVPGGRVVVVTKGRNWYAEAMRERFGHVTEAASRGYSVLTSVAAKGGGSP